jgi:hypothetical protein
LGSWRKFSPSCSGMSPSSAAIQPFRNRPRNCACKKLKPTSTENLFTICLLIRQTLVTSCHSSNNSPTNMILSVKASSMRACAPVLFILCTYLVKIQAAVNCCLAAYSSIPGGCSTADTTYEDVTYTCEDVHGSCTYCELKSPYSSSQCSKCCVEDTLTCPSDSSVASGWTTWSK